MSARAKGLHGPSSEARGARRRRHLAEVFSLPSHQAFPQCAFSTRAVVLQSSMQRGCNARSQVFVCSLFFLKSTFILLSVLKCFYVFFSYHKLVTPYPGFYRKEHYRMSLGRNLILFLYQLVLVLILPHKKFNLKGFNTVSSPVPMFVSRFLQSKVSGACNSVAPENEQIQVRFSIRLTCIGRKVEQLLCQLHLGSRLGFSLQFSNMQ